MCNSQLSSLLLRFELVSGYSCVGPQAERLHQRYGASEVKMTSKALGSQMQHNPHDEQYRVFWGNFSSPVDQEYYKVLVF